MKLRNLFFAAGASLLMLSACSGNDKDNGGMRTLADYDNVTAADSLLYYFGQLRAADYWQLTYNDSTMATRESRNEYLKGIRAGMDAAHDNDAYNQGLYVGVQIALNLREFAEGYNVEFNRQILLNALEDGLKNDSAVNAGEANQEFRQILQKLTMQKEEADRRTAVETLAEAAKAGKWQKISETLYAEGAPQGAGEGNVLKNGDAVGVKVTIGNTDGKEIDRRNTDRMVVGQGFPGPVTEALHTMKVGQTRKFYTTGPEMFGRFAERYNVKPTQIIEFTVAVTAPAPEKADTKDSADANAAARAAAAQAAAAAAQAAKPGR